MAEERIELARALCKYAHLGQTDKAGAPYYLHPFAVADKIVGEDEKVVALLHDVIEDTSIGIDTIENLFGSTISDAVLSVTKREGESYMDFVARAKQNPIGRIVKQADLEHNMDTSRLPRLSKEDVERLDKYRAALKLLQG